MQYLLFFPGFFLEQKTSLPHNFACQSAKPLFQFDQLPYIKIFSTFSEKMD